MSVHTVTITLLADNHAAYGLDAEHGFALWIEADGRRILFDTGCGDALPRNMDILGIDVRRTDAVVLSHGHYDHTGNLPWALEQATGAALYLHPSTLRSRYSIHEKPKPIGMPQVSAEVVQQLPDTRRHWVCAPVALSANVWLTGGVPRQTAYEDTGGPFFLDEEGRYADAIPDDLSLWIQTPAGLVICLGCCHAGVINTVQYIAKTSADQRIVALLGGMHLLHASEERLERTAEALKAYTILRVPTSRYGFAA
ncbi:MAG TPA: MBL fold metallo-hydrolase [Kiritimatiellia bacterium]|nr:MBL fold metallo-hydrolase [Kiritimatiellia bacterium]